MGLRRSPLSTMNRLALLCAAAGLILSTIACQVNIGGPEQPGEVIPLSAETAQEVEEAWQSALTSAALTGQLTLLLTESQATSLLQQRLESQANPIMRDPQVFLRDGVIRVYGISQRGFLQASVLITVAPRLEPDGSVYFDVTSADFGPFPVPDAVRQSISAMFTEAFTSPLGALATGVRILSIAIADGQIAIVGELR